MFKPHIFKLLMIAAIFACAPNSNSKPSKIIGENDLIPVGPRGENMPEGFKRVLNAIGYLPEVGCSAVHIGNGLVLSAGHCFIKSIQTPQEICDNSTVRFGYRIKRKPILVSRCVEVLSAQFDNKKDYTLFRIDSAPKVSAKIDLESVPAFGSSISVLGHPQGRPLEWSQYCRLESTPKLIDDSTPDFVHQCDTEGESSGSPVFDMKTRQLIGIHNGGILPWNYGTFIHTTPEIVEAFQN